MNYTIYKHTLIKECKHKGWSYIGQTLQENLAIRFKNGKGYKQQKRFWNAINYYGWDNFSHEIIETNIKSAEEANEREKYWIAYYHTYIGDKNCCGYNATIGGDGASGYLFAKEVYQISLNGEFLNSFESKMAAARYIKASSSDNINISCKNLAKRTAYGYYWCHSADFESFKTIFNINNQILKIKKLEWLKNEQLKESVKIANHAVCQFDANLVLIAQFNSIADAEKFCGIPHSSISLCCNNKAQSAGGYYWCFAKNKLSAIANFKGLSKNATEAVLKLDKNLNIVDKYINVQIAQRQTGLINIHSVLNGKFASTGGYYWCFAKDYSNFKKKLLNYKKQAVCQMSLTGEELHIFESASEAARQLNLKQPLISKCCLGQRKSTGGFT